MTSIIGTFIVIILLLTGAYAGYRDGVFRAASATLRNLIAFFVAMTFHQPLASLIGDLAGTGYPGPAYYRLIAFVLLLAIIIGLGQWLRAKYTVLEVRCHFLVDRIAGPVIGLAGGIVLSGIILVTWSLLPFVKYLPADYGRMNASPDTGALMLRFYGFAEDKMGGGRTFLVESEPLEDDNDNDGQLDSGDSFKDLNNNGERDHGWLWRYRNHADFTVAQIEEAAQGGR